MNDNPECASEVIWESHKAVKRGVLIKHEARIKKEREAKLTMMLLNIHRLEARQKNAPTTEVKQELLSTHRQVTDLLQYRAKMSLQLGRKCSYESANKCGRQLARALRELHSTIYVPSILNVEVDEVKLPKQIADVFGDFYSSLYNLNLDVPDKLVMEDYLAAYGMPSLTAITQQELESPITLEVQTVRRTARMGKAPGPYSFTVQY